MPPSREQRVEQKRFYFDVGSNTRGVYLRISEVSTWLYIKQSTDWLPVVAFILVDQRLRDGLRATFSNLCTNEYITFCSCKRNTSKKFQKFEFQMVNFGTYFISFQTNLGQKIGNITYQANLHQQNRVLYRIVKLIIII